MSNNQEQSLSQPSVNELSQQNYLCSKWENETGRENGGFFAEPSQFCT